jgi:hypothetical protein
MTRLKTIEVSVYDLLLDPNNPRLIRELGDIKCVPDEDIENENLQSTLLDKFDISGSKKEDAGFFNTEGLANGIEEVGLVPGNAIAVRKLQNSNKYVVIEGNRRISTVKHLLAKDKKDDNFDLQENVKQNLQMVFVKLIPEGPHQEKMIADILITRHGSQSQLSWGAYETALYILDKYLSLNTQGYEPLKIENFKFNKKRARVTAKVCSKTDKYIQDSLKTVMVYRQIEEELENDKIRPADYSLLKALVTNAKLLTGYLNLNDQSFLVEGNGCEKIETICQFGKRDNEDKILKDDKAVPRLANLYKATNHTDEALAKYADRLLKEVEQGETNLDKANAYYLTRAKSREFIQNLEAHLQMRSERSGEGEELCYEKFQNQGNDLLEFDSLIASEAMAWLKYFQNNESNPNP